MRRRATRPRTVPVPYFQVLLTYSPRTMLRTVLYGYSNLAYRNPKYENRI